MSGRTIAIGDIHGELEQLQALVARLPTLDEADTLVFLGDYLDRGPDAAGVIDLIRRTLPARTKAQVVTLRGSHEDAWLRVRREGWLEFILPVGNGCLASLRSFRGGPPVRPGDFPEREELEALAAGSFLPADVVEWLISLRCYYEDEHAIYVHAGLPEREGRFVHPSELQDPHPLFWQRSSAFFEDYTGKRVVFGHTATEYLPQAFSCYTPDDAKDLFVRGSLVGIDTGCGRGGFLSAIELPSLRVYESRG
jgi:serine/threonine protein phosphatase 1